jgi:hypothetical protein
MLTIRDFKEVKYKVSRDLDKVFKGFLAFRGSRDNKRSREEVKI